MSELDLKFLAIAMPFIWGFLHILIISIVALLITDWEEKDQ